MEEAVSTDRSPWQPGKAGLSAGEMAGLCCVPALAGRDKATWCVGLVPQACILPLKTETSLLCLVPVPAMCRARLCWGKV